MSSESHNRNRKCTYQLDSLESMAILRVISVTHILELLNRIID